MDGDARVEEVTEKEVKKEKPLFSDRKAYGGKFVEVGRGNPIFSLRGVLSTWADNQV